MTSTDPTTHPTNFETTYSPSLLSLWLATTEGGLPQIASDDVNANPKPPPRKKQKVAIAVAAEEEEKKKKKKKSEKPSAGKSRRIRVYPNARQKAILLRWFGTARWTYNKCLAWIKRGEIKISKKELRSKVINNENYSLVDTWVRESTPYEVRHAAMVDLINAYTSNFAKKRKNKEHRFELRFRSKKSPQEAIMIRGKCFKKSIFYPMFFGREALRSSEPLPETIDYDCKLLHTRLGHYYLCIPMPLEPASDNQARKQPQRVVALDPGVRTFHTAYDPSGVVMEFGKGDIGHIYRICAHMDKLQSKITHSNLHHKARYRMRRAWRKMQWRIHNLIDDCHKKMVKFLCSNYSVILLPSFESQKMVSRSKRKIQSKSARAMMTWSHYRFKQRLLFKRQEYPWCHVVICNEAYTSKTCGRCGHLHPSLGSSKHFKCPSCQLELDRDVNGARNILLRNASLFGLEIRETLGLTPSLPVKGQRAWPTVLNGFEKNC